eukprot:COSAG06_NODE_22167_length_732_cov_0.658768_1_plen_33_part_10
MRKERRVGEQEEKRHLCAPHFTNDQLTKTGSGQ